VTSTRDETDTASPPAWRRLAARYGPLAVLAAVALAAWGLGLPKMLSPAALAGREVQIRAAAAAAPTLALGVYVLTYTVLTGACLPVAMMLSPIGGLIFGAWVGAGAILVGATGAAMLTYAAARTAFAPALLGRAERDARLGRIMDGFGRNAFAYLLTLRLFPFFPFALVNVAAGLAAVPVRAYAAATLVGGVPTAVIYSSLGAGLGRSLGSERALSAALRSPQVMVPLLVLAVLSVAPALVQRLRDRRRAAA